MVDGGKGQLNLAVAVLKHLDLTGRFDVIAIAKKEPERGETEDKIFKPGRKNPLNLKKTPDVLLFLQRVRDEAHRFVIQYHRKRRMLHYKKSVLEDVPGIGPERRKKLLKHFGSVKRIREATIDQLEGAPGMTRKVAEDLVKALKYR
jgi:excinuclease ABC subunit C